jgi:hypothetical protein
MLMEIDFIVVFAVGSLAVIAVVAVAILVTGILREEHRTERLRAVAEGMNLTFSEADDSLLAMLSHFHLFSRGFSGRIRNIIRGQVGDIAVTVFDYRYVVGSHQSRTREDQTVILFESDDMRLPAFSLRPEGLGEKLAGIFGGQDIDFESHPTFSQMYLLRSDRESEVRELFTPEVLSYFETQQTVSAEAAGGQLIFYEAYRRVAPEQLPEFIKDGARVVALFKA